MAQITLTTDDAKAEDLANWMWDVEAPSLPSDFNEDGTPKYTKLQWFKRGLIRRSLRDYSAWKRNKAISAARLATPNDTTAIS